MLSEDTSLYFPQLAVTFSFGNSIRTHAQTTNKSGMKRSVREDRLVTVMCHVSKTKPRDFLSSLNSFSQNTINQINTLRHIVDVILNKTCSHLSIFSTHFVFNYIQNEKRLTIIIRKNN